MRTKQQRTGGLTLVLAISILGTTVACSRSSNSGSSGPPQTTASSGVSVTSPAASDTGDFGDLKHICGPGAAKGATQKGVTDSSIRIGTTADPGAAAAPGLEQEFFDVASAFSKWCNAAGGINGRKIIVDKWDAQLFNVGQAFTNACQKDFMVVGNGNAFDSAGVKPREACKLGDIFAYTVGPDTATSKDQVSAQPSNPKQYAYGPLRLLIEAYPDSKKGVAIGQTDIASLLPQGKRLEQALKTNDVVVTALQNRPPLVDNFRPYMEALKGANTFGLDEMNGQDITPEIQAMKNVGWNPQFLLFSTQFYLPATISAARSLKTFPNSYVGLSSLPFELAGTEFPVLTQAKNILAASIRSPRYTSFSINAFSAWALWAKEATACGSTLTSTCVLEKAAAEKGWTGGGLAAPVDLDPANPRLTECYLDIRLTTSGWVYDRKVTNPNKGVYNCSPQNVVGVDSFQ